jgi:protein-disulfide isomerase
MMIKSLFLVSAALFFSSCSESISSPNYKFMPPAGNTVAKVAGVEITAAEMNQGIEAELYEAEMKLFDVKFNKVKTLLIEKLMEQDPKKKGLSNDEYLEKYIASKITISEKDVDAFVKEKSIPAEHMNAQLRERIKGFLMIEKKKTAIDQWLADKTGKAGIEVYLAKPQRPNFDVKFAGAPTSGSDSAKITIVEFSDFQCPFCKKAAETVEEVKKKYGNKVRVAFKQFPLPFHKNAQKSAEAALCAHDQKKESFWKMHDKMFGAQDQLEVDGLKKMAKEIGLDVKAFDACLDGAKFAAQVEQDMKDGQAVGVKSTPTFFINGKLLSGAQPIEEFDTIISEELTK